MIWTSKHNTNEEEFYQTYLKPAIAQTECFSQLKGVVEMYAHIWSELTTIQEGESFEYNEGQIEYTN